MTPIEEAAERVASARHVAVLSGAGVSAESGIPTFRGLGGLWRGRDPMTLATPSAFAADPATVWEFYAWRRDLVAKAEPNPAHRALARLAGLVSSLTLVTQNVDRLHQRAGSRDVLELHGNLGDVRCTGCGETSDRWGIPLPPLPTCDACGGLLRPAVVWFGEMLPPDIWTQATEAVADAEVLLVVGTSAMVHPAAGLATLATELGHTVIEVNPDPTPITDLVTLSLPGPAGVILPAILSAMGDRPD